MFTTTHSERFDDIDADAGYACHGWNYEVSGDGIRFLVRVYDDEPGKVTVVSPTNARVLPDAHDLLNYLLASLRASVVSFYDPTTGIYRVVDNLSLEFV